MAFDFPPAGLMIIGDSLAQGCRSLTVKRDFCTQSWAARIAQTQGWVFNTPDFPIPVLFDLEQEVRVLNTSIISIEHLRFEGFFGRVRDNLNTWLTNASESAFTCFDNLGLSGCLIDDLYTRTARTSAEELAELAPHGASLDVLDNLVDQKFASLHLAINSRFTLNPSQDPELNDLTQLDWVEKRRPKILLVQVGHNHGLYSIGADAQDGSFTQSGGTGHAEYFDQWGELARRLALLPPEVGTILVVLLPKLGAVANLQPRGVEREQGYAESYEPVLSASTNILAGDRLRTIDQAIQSANQQIRQILVDAATTSGAANRLRFLDTFALFDALDFKDSLDESRRLPVTPTMTIDNRYLESKQSLRPPFGRQLVAGGFQSIDGMHATGCGYADLASEVMKVLGLAHDRTALLSKGFDEDELLTHYPIELDFLVSILGVARKLQHVNRLVLPRSAFFTEQLGVGDALRMMKQVVTR